MRIGIFLLFIALSLSADGVVSWRVFTDDAAPQTGRERSRLLRGSETDALRYLNEMRVGSGMIPFRANNLLDSAARNHSLYLITNNTFGHYEDSSSSGFTGVRPSDRGTYVGYDWCIYSENIAGGDANITESIDGLMSAIYHRFGFLNFMVDEIGISWEYDAGYFYKSVATFNMASPNSNSCSNNLDANPEYVAWPHAGYTRAQTSFFNQESPDPVPECNGVNGNPISIEFNGGKTGTITMHSFKIYDDNGSEIIDTKALDASNDPNGHLGDRQFVLFPMRSLDIDSRYRVEFAYDEDGVDKNIVWHFNTRRYDHKRYEVKNNHTYNVISGETYLFHLKPDDCNTTFYRYSWNSSSVQIERMTFDLFRITASGDVTISFPDNNPEFTFSLHISSDDDAIEPSSTDSPSSMISIINYLLL